MHACTHASLGTLTRLPAPKWTLGTPQTRFKRTHASNKIKTADELTVSKHNMPRSAPVCDAGIVLWDSWSRCQQSAVRRERGRFGQQRLQFQVWGLGWAYTCVTLPLLSQVTPTKCPQLDGGRARWCTSYGCIRLPGKKSSTYTYHSDAPFSALANYAVNSMHINHTLFSCRGCSRGRGTQRWTCQHSAHCSHIKQPTTATPAPLLQGNTRGSCHASPDSVQMKPKTKYIGITSVGGT
jgi:hypothetical protein